MKCVRCGKDSNYKDRSGKKCPGCHHSFAFEPKDGDPVTDMMFHNAIKAVSGDGKVRWGVEHLFYEVNRRKWAQRRMPLGCIIFFAVWVGVWVGILTLATTGSKKLFPFAFFGTIVGVVGLLVGGVSRFRGPFVRIDLDTFNRLWGKWRTAFGKPAGLIERVPDPPVPKDLEADIGDYSFDRAVICDRARTVDLLVANNFHFENNCAILSVDGYPKGPFPIVRKMLKRNPKLLVFALHDASLVGCRLAHRLITDPEWFGGAGLRVIDLGLRPRHAGPFKGLLLPGDGVKLDDEDGIAADEAQWLRKYKLELAAARPEQVLKRLFAGLMAHANGDPRTGSSDGAVIACGAFDAGGYAGDGDAGEGAADAFG